MKLFTQVTLFCHSATKIEYLIHQASELVATAEQQHFSFPIPVFFSTLAVVIEKLYCNDQ